MTIFGSSAYGGSVTEWVRIDNKLRSMNGNYGMQARRSYASSVPSSFENSGAYADYHKRISALSIAVDPEQMAAGDFDNKLRTYVNDVPADHTIYLGYFHEPEDNMSAAAFGAAWARFAQVILNEGNTNIIPSGCLMAYTFQTGSGRDEHAWVPGELLSGAERDACLFGVDGYAREVPAQRTPNWLFDYPWQVIRDEGFDRVGVFECGVNQESPRTAWMLNLETHAASRDVELICWWHSHNFAEGRWFYIELDGAYTTLADPGSTQTWADIIGRNQDDSAPVVVVPPGDLPDPTDPPPDGGGGTPVPWNPSPGIFTSSGEWSDELQVADGNAGVENFAVSPFLMVNSDDTATMAWVSRPHGGGDASISCARFAPGSTPTVQSIHENQTPTFSGLPVGGRGFTVGSNLFVVYVVLTGITFTTQAALFDPDGVLLHHDVLTATPGSGRIVQTGASTVMMLSGGHLKKVEVSESVFTGWTEISSNIDGDLEPPLSVYDITYSPEAGTGLAISEQYDEGLSAYLITVRPWSTDGTTVTPLGTWVACTDQELEENWDGTDQARTGSGAVLSATVDSGDRGHLYHFDATGNMTGSVALAPDTLVGNADNFYNAVNSNDDVIWIDQFSPFDLHFTSDVFGTQTDVAVDLGYGSFDFQFVQDGESNGSIAWFGYTMVDHDNYSNSEYFAVRCLVPAETPNLAGEFESRERVFPRGPTNYTP